VKIFRNGLLTGLLLQLAIGPVFLFIINLTLQKTLLNGLAAVVAVTLVDYLYIALTILGVGKLLEKKKIKKVFGIISSIVLILFGLMIIKNALIDTTSITLNPANTTSLLSSFSLVFFLTISSPLTIVMWTSLFATKAIENNYSKHELLIFGLSAGLATLIFMGTSVVLISLLKETIPLILIQILNIIVGILLILYGAARLNK